jgi:hypothetical protein
MSGEGGPDFLAENEAQTAKAAASEHESEEKGAQGAAAASKKGGALPGKGKAPASDAQQSGASAPAQGGGLIGAIKNTIKPQPAQPVGGVGGAPSPAPQGGLIGAVKGAFKKGGEVPETGDFQLHKGEEVLPAKRASEYRTAFTQRGAAGKHKYGGK